MTTYLIERACPYDIHEYVVFFCLLHFLEALSPRRHTQVNGKAYIAPDIARNLFRISNSSSVMKVSFSFVAAAAISSSSISGFIDWNALQPAEVSKVVLDEEAERIEVVVPEEQLSLAIGRRGQNVRLASQLTNLDIDIMTEAEESARRQKEFEERTQLFMETLDLDEFFAQLLVSEGFTSLEEVAYVEVDELLVIDGVDEDTAKELQVRAQEYLEEAARKALERARELGVEDSLVSFEGLTPKMIEALAEDGIKTLEDFATCADWELAGGWTTVDGERVKDDGLLESFDVSLEEAQDLVMTARIILGWVDPNDLITEGADADDAAETEEES